MDDAIQAEINRLKNLRNYHNMSLEVLTKKAIVTVKLKEFEAQNIFQDMAEKKSARDLFEKYLEEYEFETTSDILRLQDLIFKYILKCRVQQRLNEMSSSVDEKGEVKKIYLGEDDVKPLLDLEKAITADKLALGIDRNTDEKKDELTGLQMLMKRFGRYINFNRNEFTTVCAHCGTLLLLRRRVKAFENLLHPFFSGRWLYNPAIIHDAKAGKITKEQAARYLRTSPDYVEYAIKNEGEICSCPGIPQEAVDEFIEKNPYLHDAYEQSKEAQENKE